MKFHSTCLICNCPNLQKLLRFEHAFLVKCGECGFIFSGRIPEETELLNHYTGYPRNTTVSGITLKRYNELLSSFEKYRKLNRILDVGCGDGHFLEQARKRGWETFGTEFSSEAVTVCRKKGLFVEQGKLTTSIFPVPFDIITSFEVLEHTADPAGELRSIHSLLREGGIFYFTTPNFNSVNRYLLKEKWSIVEYPEHLCYFTGKTIHALLTGIGFRKAYLRTTGLSFSRLSRGLGNKDSVSYKTLDEKIRSSAENSFVLTLMKKSADTILSILSSGDTLKGLYTK